MSEERSLISTPMRIIGFLFILLLTFCCLVMTYQLFTYELSEKEWLLALFLLPSTLYFLLFLAPPILFNSYPNWTKKLLPNWLVTAAYQDFAKEGVLTRLLKARLKKD
jgi:uncharacterized membrane protein YdbT with pleckstrin-like domain